MKIKTQEIKKFAKELISEIQNDDMFSAASDLTYKILFSLFPFIIFLMAIVGFLKLDADILIDEISSVLPYAINESVQNVIKEILRIRNANILSFSLLISVTMAIYSASSGFNSAMRCINKAYGQKDDRKFWVKILISMSLVLIFTVIIIASFILLIFGDNILDFIKEYFNLEYIYLFYIFNVLRYVVSVITVFLCVLLINKLAVHKKTKLKSLFPGSVFTVLTWFTASWLFNVYIENFTNYSSIYGSIAGIIILMLWLNIMCIVLLLGSEINALIEIREKD
ncbi:MAG: YihY/virulence factor BrkB family protein [Oscillospiraceae bacterium]|nr:YihY/virulence factor BrkB family protein [Oscillospiraceae bacterium]